MLQMKQPNSFRTLVTIYLSTWCNIYKRILGPVYENEKENWRILTNKEIYASVKKPTIIETTRLG